MSGKGEYYQYGYKVGQFCARDSRKEIETTGSGEALGKLTGMKMDKMRLQVKDEVSNRSDWREGFFDGFMDRAKEFV